MQQNPPVSRRQVVTGMVAAAVSGAVGDAMAQTTRSATAPAPPPITTAPATTQASDITTDDLAVVDRVHGFHYSDADHQLMAGGVAEQRGKLDALRRRHIDPRIEPAVQFNPRLPGTALPKGESLCRLSDAPLIQLNGNLESLAFASVAELSRLLRARAITSTDLTKMYLSRLKKFGPRLLCVVNLCESLALQQAARADAEIAAGNDRGPLHGIPYGAKDLLATKGIPTTWGAKPYIDQVFDFNATVVQRLEDAGAVLLAKLTLGELAMGDVWFGGMTRNPWKPSEGSSGSSAGPGSATAAGLVGFSIGSETLGSIVSPCCTNGTTGLRPTYGRVSRYGAMPLARTMDKLGPMTRGVEDCALVLSAIHGADGLDPTAVADMPLIWDPSSASFASAGAPLRVGYDKAAFDRAAHGEDEHKRKVYADALEAVRKIAGELKPVTLPPVDRYKGLAGLTIAAESASSFSELVHSGRVSELKQQDEGSWPNTFRVGSYLPAADYLRAQQVRAELQRDMAVTMMGIDCYVAIPYAGPTLAYTNLTGHPSLVTRCGATADGLPLMIEFIGDLYREDAILRLGFAYERATDWHTKWPDTEKIPQL